MNLRMKTFGSLINLSSHTKLSYQKLSSLLIGQFLTNACKEFQVFTNGGRFRWVCGHFYLPVAQTEGKYPHIECLVIDYVLFLAWQVFRAGSWQHHVNILNEVSCLASHLYAVLCSVAMLPSSMKDMLLGNTNFSYLSHKIFISRRLFKQSVTVNDQQNAI